MSYRFTKVGLVRSLAAHLQSQGKVLVGTNYKYAASLILDPPQWLYVDYPGFTVDHYNALVTGTAVEGALGPGSAYGHYMDDVANVEAYLLTGRVGG